MVGEMKDYPGEETLKFKKDEHTQFKQISSWKNHDIRQLLWQEMSA